MSEFGRGGGRLWPVDVNRTRPFPLPPCVRNESGEERQRCLHAYVGRGTHKLARAFFWFIRTLISSPFPRPPNRRLDSLPLYTSAPLGSAILSKFVPLKCKHCGQKFCGEHSNPPEASHKCDKYDEHSYHLVVPRYVDPSVSSADSLGIGLLHNTPAPIQDARNYRLLQSPVM